MEGSNPVDIIYIYVPLLQGGPDFILLNEIKKSFTVGSTVFPDPQARSKSHPPNFLLLCVWEYKWIEQTEYARFIKIRRYTIKSTLHGIIQAALFLKSMKFL